MTGVGGKVVRQYREEWVVKPDCFEIRTFLGDGRDEDGLSIQVLSPVEGRKLLAEPFEPRLVAER